MTTNTEGSRQAMRKQRKEMLIISIVSLVAGAICLPLFLSVGWPVMMLFPFVLVTEILVFNDMVNVA